MIPALTYYQPAGLQAGGRIRILRPPRVGEIVQITISTPFASFQFSYGVDFLGDNPTSIAAALANAINGDRATFGVTHSDPRPLKPFLAVYYGDTVSIYSTLPGPAGNSLQISETPWTQTTQPSGGRFAHRLIAQDGSHDRTQILSILPGAYLGHLGNNREAVDRYLLVFDRQSDPLPTSTPVATFTLYANSPVLFQLQYPIPCTSGIVVAISDSPTTYNPALPDNFDINLAHFIA